MLPLIIKKQLIIDDKKLSGDKSGNFKLPRYNPKTYYKDVSKGDYFSTLLLLRHYLKLSADYFFNKEKAINIDLFMLTTSVSSPMGPGSDSKPLPLTFGKLKTFMVDSSQFGFEPILLMQNMDKVFCYLPSMRAEDFDTRHLNQFFHLEAEIIGTHNTLMPLVEKLVRNLCRTLLLMDNILDKISLNPQKTKKMLKKIIEKRKFPRISFDVAVEVLINNNKKHLINFTPKGRDIKSKGEIELMRILKIDTPLWITNFDRDRVPFYQKPDPNNIEKTINADLLFPPLVEKSFGGEIIGSGQRQDNSDEIYESLERQSISSKSYEWYIDLRRNPKYQMTSGFGLGVERFIAWALARDNIRDVIIYPRLKNIIAYP
jgi:asparaginyl-tRNA synthetase